MNNIIYKSHFKTHIQNYIKLKQSVGYKYETQAMRLKRFDKFILEKYFNATVLSKDIVLDWCNKKPYEAQANQSLRVSIIRQFAEYLSSIEIKAYIVPNNYCSKKKKYMPHIYSSDELYKFFAETDKCRCRPEFPYRHLIMPVIFRMIYMCGLRASEARLLKVADVDLKNGILSIHQSKKDNSRLVPMSDCLTVRCREFSKQVHSNAVAEDYYFPALNGKPMTLGNLYKNFRKFLWRARISHGGMGKGPRIHDMRHTYAVHCLKKWSMQGKNLTAYLPVLRIYMGHNSFEETAYYLHLTADVFPEITLKIETQYPGIIPTLEGDPNETN
jgi:integrase/recombinase XerD